MNNDLTLLIMAGGMGSRFGGLKQLQPVGKKGELLIDYSIYDAVKAGFSKVVFVIKEENYDLFKETVGERVQRQIKVEYVFQKMEDLPEGYTVPESRGEKPWGTAHAVLAAADKIDGKFAIINADDFYGKNAFEVAAEFLKEKQADDGKRHYAVVGYQIANTTTENGSVKRGVCEAKDGYLTKITESQVERVDGAIQVSPLDGSPSYTVADDCLVSMNMMTFTPDIFDYIRDNFPKFLDDNKGNIDKCEYLIPEVLQMTIADGTADVKVLATNAKWYGVTYREDLPSVVDAIAKMVEDGEYPENLWS